MLTGVPLVIGVQPWEHLAKAAANVGKVGRALGALWPAYLLVQCRPSTGSGRPHNIRTLFASRRPS